MPNCVFLRAFCAYEKYFMNFHTLLLCFSQCDRAIRFMLGMTDTRQFCVSVIDVLPCIGDP